MYNACLQVYKCQPFYYYYYYFRIEDIEAETPQEEQVNAQQPEMHDVSELVQTEVCF